MNAMQKNEQAALTCGQPEWLSALVDGEADASQVDALFADPAVDADLHARWHCYQLVGDALRDADSSLTLRSPQSFLAGVMAGLSEAQETRPLRLERNEGLAHVRAPAANDAVMRWKMLAGVASVAAVVAVSWGVLSGVPGTPAGVAAPSVQMAEAINSPSTPLALTQPVAVKTERGTLIRDARLEKLLAEHRQYGGATALQVPAGFLRNATYEAAPQR